MFDFLKQQASKFQAPSQTAPQSQVKKQTQTQSQAQTQVQSQARFPSQVAAQSQNSYIQQVIPQTQTQAQPQSWTQNVSSQTQAQVAGAAKKDQKKYKNRWYKVRVGANGGRYILVSDSSKKSSNGKKKIYV